MRWRQAAGTIADWSRRYIDIPLILVAVLFALPTLAYAEGRDQASFHYIAREWLHGRLPYRDMVDQKPPLIYVVHVVAILISGGAQWGIRLLDIVALLGMAAVLARGLPRPVPRGATGVLAILLLGFHATAFDYWMSAQVEIWEGLAMIGAWTLVERDDRPDRRAALSGLLSALAILFKLTAVIGCILIALRLGWRAFAERRWRGLGRAALLHAVAGAVPFLLVILYWGAHGALGDLWEVAIEFTLGYASNARDWAQSWEWTVDWFTRSFYYPAFIVLWIAGLAVAVRGRDRVALREFAWGAVLLVAALANVVVQRKFFAYHWCITLPFTVLLARHVVARACARWPFLSAAAALAVLVVGFLLAPGWNVDLKWTYRNYTDAFMQYRRGELPREKFLAYFNQRGHQYGDMEAVASKLRELAGPNDTLCVEGYEPAFYVISGLRCSHRFYATMFLSDPRGDLPMIARWRGDHLKALAAHPPEFAVDHSNKVLTRKGCKPVYRHGLWALGDCRKR